MRTTVLVIHIVAVAAWLGANLVQAVTGPAAAKAEPAARRWWAQTQLSLARVYYNVAGVVVLLTGLYLVIDGDVKFSSTFVSIGFLAVILGAVFGIFVFAPGTRKIIEAIDSGDEATEKSVSNRLAGVGMLDSLILIVTIVAMVGAWGVKLS